MKEEITRAEYVEELDVTDTLFKTATELYKYLEDVKKLTPETVDKYHIGQGLLNQLVIPCSGAELIFNADALLKADDKPIVVTNSALDAMSVEQCGGSAIAIKGKNYKALIDAIKRMRAEGKTFAVCLKRGEAEKTEQVENGIINALNKLKIISYRKELTGEYNSINEFLQNDEKQLQAEIRLLLNSKELYLKESAAGHIDKLNKYLNPDKKPFISTGFNKLDDALCGGLYPGLYVMGAATGVGKTAFALQMMDYIAKQGRDVLIFALEMGESELIARSLSRLSYIKAKTMGKENLAKTVRGILNGGKYNSDSNEIEKFSEDEIRLIEECGADYMSYAGHIFIEEGIGSISYVDIRNRITEHISITGNKPVVLVDYLQILAAGNENKERTEKQITDKAILELKRMSRDFDIPIFTISSFNRDSYLQDVSTSSFKESGGIEYGVDVLLGLQLDMGSEKTEDSMAKAMQDDKRHLKLKILKHRNGKARAEISIAYLSAFNYFKEEQSYS